MENIITLSKVYSHHLQNERDIYVYLPPSYNKSTFKRYPVLYAQDGQHMFKADKKGGSWDIHVAANNLIENGVIDEVIIVAVSSIYDKRASEYFHFNSTVMEAFQTECSGDKYEKFIIEELKPLVDAQFRTKPDKENTAVIGSSAGGLISYHLAFRNRNVFGLVGILSPFFVHSTVVNGVLKEVPIYEQYHEQGPQKVWMDIGGVEGLITVSQVRKVADELLSVGYTSNDDFAFLMDANAGHTQQDWANRIYSVLIFLFGKKGKPVNLHIWGRTKIGLNNRHYQLYSNVTYNSGYQVSLLEANYIVENPQIINVLKDGTMLPKTVGKTKIKVEFEGLNSEVVVEVIEQLSNEVTLEMTVHVPDNTPSDAAIHAGLEIPKINNGLYSARFQLPRDLRFDVLVSRGFGVHEKRNERRTFSTEEDLVLQFIVDRWEDL